MIESERSDAVDLANGVTLEVHTASFRAVRGYTIVAALLDEVAFWAGKLNLTRHRDFERGETRSWRRYRARCCYALARRMHDAVCCGMPTTSSSVRKGPAP